MAEEKEEKEIKINFFKKLFYSITKFEKYPEMATHGVTSAIKYLVVVMLIFSIIVATGLVFQLYNTAKKGIYYFQNELPNISYSDGKLDISSNEAIIINTGELFIDKIIIDTKNEDEEIVNEYLSSIAKEKVGLIALKDKILIKASGANEIFEYTYPEILSSLIGKDISSLTKQDIINYVTGSGMVTLYATFFIVMLLYVFLVYSISVIVDTLLIAILGNITTIFAKIRLKFSAVYSMSIYALTLSILLNAIYITINTITGFQMPYFQVMYISIAYVYIVAALFMIKSDLIKNQAELMKIINEQEKVRKEIQDKQEEKQKEKNKENKKPEEKKEKEDKKGKEKDNDDKEPTGSEA